MSTQFTKPRWRWGTPHLSTFTLFPACGSVSTILIVNTLPSRWSWCWLFLAHSRCLITFFNDAFFRNGNFQLVLSYVPRHFHLHVIVGRKFSWVNYVSGNIKRQKRCQNIYKFLLFQNLPSVLPSRALSFSSWLIVCCFTHDCK